MTDVFYIEDDPDIAGSVRYYLEQRAMKVRIFSTVAAARDALRTVQPSVLLVDWNMPDGDGMAFCRELREHWPQLPMIMLTVRGNAAEIAAGLRDGADDYVVKPFHLEVLYSRICALLRRSSQAPQTRVHCGELMLDTQKQAVYRNQEEIPLSNVEYRLLLMLMRNMGRTVTRAQLLDAVWDSQGLYVNDNTLTVAMKRLREKLHNPACLKTVRSFGYRMEDVL